mmetsp:Transcript_6102/g.14172  ORF Transcript_6102/g.14172 Transcript_6102/m.14172 type:complete len:962 (-) Transcript_6102:330-3215(-)
MGSCCGCCGKTEEENKKLNKASFNDELKDGPVSKRGCTDIFCLPIFIIAQVVFIVVTIAGLSDGDPTKLYKPRDYQGAYCGVDENWNDGPVTTDQPMLSYTMNVTSAVDTMMKQLVCSSIAQQALVEGASGISPLITSVDEQNDYLCDCCITPCTKCTGSLEVGGDLTTGSSLQSTITSRMSDLTSTSTDSVSSLFSPSGSNGDLFSATSFWNEATKYFNQVCLPDCNTNFNNINTTAESQLRNYTYTPAPDDALYGPWQYLLNAPENDLTSEIVATITSAFTFKALPKSVCPYEAAQCVPFPGMEFSEIASGLNRCQFELAAEVVSAVGSAAAASFSSLGGEAFANAASSSFGEWMGDFLQTLDSFFVVSTLAFVVGIVFLVLLRFFIGFCVWLSVGATVFFFFLGGLMAFVRSGQCANADFFDSGTQTVVAVAVAASTAATNAVTGTETVSEALTGDGQDYRGVQTYTKLGLGCAKWDEQTVMSDYTSTNYPNSSLTANYCRNPYNDGDWHKASTIWCITDDPETKWQECLPIGVIQPECDGGYAVSSENARKALEICAYIIWGIGGVWILIIFCLFNRIRLAIALNKVAAQFLSTNVTVVLVPAIQAVIGILWCVAWMAGASFLLSQVPSGYTPTESYATYEEAYGTTSSCAFWEFGDGCSATPGACNNKWPTGSVWKDTDCGTGTTAKCWKCYPPRYVLDVRFACSFFVFLWNNAFNVALGQMIIAMAVSLWFFSQDKGKVSASFVRRGVKTVFRYHLGTVAFGSFIIAVVQFIRYLMKYFEKQAAAQKNRVMVLVLKIMQCCIWCLENFLKFLNKNAYIQTALLGTNFCTSAKKAFYLILRNAIRFATAAALTGAVYLVGFVCIMAGTTVLGYFVVRGMHDEINPVIPVISYIAMSYVVSKLFMNVFNLAVSTCLQCFLVCEEMAEKGHTFEDIPSVMKKWVKSNIKSKGSKDEAK